MLFRSTTLGLAAGLLVLPAAATPGDARSGWDQDWCAGDGEGRGKARHCEVREVALPAGDALRVDAQPNGGIRVRGVDRGQARLWARVIATADTEADARSLAGQVRIDTAGTIRALGPDPSGRGRGWSVSFRAEVPRRSDLDLRAHNGGLCVENVAGSIELQTVNGGLHLEGAGGRVHGQTVNGGLHVELSGAEWDGEGLDLRTTNGGVHLSIPSDYNARLEAATVNGGVHTDLPVAGGRRARGIEADLGRGGPLLHLETTNGGLHVGRE